MIDLFVEILRISLSEKDKLSKVPTESEWHELYCLCEKQAIQEIMLEGISKLSEMGLKPPFNLLMEWIGQSEQIRLRNKHLNQTVTELIESFKKDGYDCCLLKGQGNNLLYPNVYVRTPGDIDIWITPTDKSLSEKQRVKNVLCYLRRRYPIGFLHYNHIDGGSYNGVEVEVHHRPRFMNNLIHNARMQKWICEKREEQFANFVRLPDIDANVAIPTWEFNVVFQLAHIYGHVLQSGIGLRHIVDYYYLLKSKVSYKREELTLVLRHLGLDKIACAVMWVLHEVLGLKEEFLIAPMDQSRGRALWDEILRGGNFGYYDEKNYKIQSPLHRNIQRLKRDLQMMQYYPAECFWEPLFRLYHWMWRVRYNKINIKQLS